MEVGVGRKRRGEGEVRWWWGRRREGEVVVGEGEEEGGGWRLG